jgi:fatty-acyl-CoA synthase
MDVIEPFPLSIGALVRRGLSAHRASTVCTYDGVRVQRSTYAEVGERAGRLAGGLSALGIGEREVVAACCWNTQEFLEVFLAVPGVGACLHTINPRLSSEQLEYVIAHAGERTVICDATLLPVLLSAPKGLAGLDRLVLIGETAPSLLADVPCDVVAYEDLLAAGSPGYDWPDRDERLPATLCYTTGTTGDPKGAVYTHRAIVLHSLGETGADSLAISARDRVLPASSMFHVNAWGLPYTSWLAGADLILAGRHLQPEHLARLLAEEQPTVMAGVPTIFNDLRRHARDGASLDLSSLRLAMCGGSPVPRPLIAWFRDTYGVPLTQAWGMTENGLLTVGHPPPGATGDEELDWRAATGRLVAGIEGRVVDDQGVVLPSDGKATGELQLRGWWVIRQYHRSDDMSRFSDGWLLTGDVGTIDQDGWVQVTDRAKDVIKSGGEWISSVALEAAIMSHPAVHEAAVIAVADERWFERPLACVALADGATVAPSELCDHLRERVVKWWVPERWAFVAEVPKTSVGKPDKKRLRSMLTDGRLAVQDADPASTPVR